MKSIEDLIKASEGVAYWLPQFLHNYTFLERAMTADELKLIEEITQQADFLAREIQTLTEAVNWIRRSKMRGLHNRSETKRIMANCWWLTSKVTGPPPETFNL